jgi:hypothetical protein
MAKQTKKKHRAEARRGEYIRESIFYRLHKSGKQAKVGNLGGDKRENAFFRRHGYRKMITKLLSGRVTKKKLNCRAPIRREAGRRAGPSPWLGEKETRGRPATLIEKL